MNTGVKKHAKHLSKLSMWARVRASKHAKQLSTWARLARDLAGSFSLWTLIFLLF